MRYSSPQRGPSPADEQPRRKRNFRSRHHSRSQSPPVERNRERSPSQRRRRSRSRSRSPVRFRRSRNTRPSSSSSSRSGARVPLVLMPGESLSFYSAAPRWARTERSNERPSPNITLPPSGVPELAPLYSSSPRPILIQPSLTSRSRRSRSTRTRSRTPPPIISTHSPVSISIDPPESPPLPPLFSAESSDAEYELTPSPTTSQPPLPGPDVSTRYPSVPSIRPIRPPVPEEGDVRDSVVMLPPPLEFSAQNGYPFREETDTSSSVSFRRGAAIGKFVSEPAFVENGDSVRFFKRPVGLWDSSETVHLMTYVAAFAFDTLPRQLYLHFLLRLPYMYFSRVTRIFEEAEMSMPQIKQGILDAAIQLKEPVKDVADAWQLEPVESAQYSKLQNTWQSFIDSLMREWKTLNIISVLLLS